MQFTNPADGLVADLHTRGPPWMQRRMCSRLESHIVLCGESLQIAFHVEKIHPAGRHAPLFRRSGAKRHCPDARRLPDACHIYAALGCTRCALKHASDFEQSNTVLLAVQVVAHLIDEPADKAATHHRELTRDGVEHPNRMRIACEIGLPGGLHESEVDDLLIIRTRELSTQLMQRASRLRSRAHHRRRNGWLRGDAFESVHP